MGAVLKASLFVGTVLLLGGGLFPRWLSAKLPDPATRQRLRLGLTLGGMLLLIGSLSEVALLVAGTFGRVTPAALGEYLFYTRHGRAVLVRSALTLMLMVWGLRVLVSPALDRVAHATASLGVLASSSWVSHSGTTGTLPLVGDVLHLIGATLWAGAVIYLAWLPIWPRERATLPLKQTVQRVSQLGLVSVLLLSATGVYMATLHMFGLEALTTTSYGLSLVVKVGLIAIILVLAGVNRWLLVPLLENRSLAAPLQKAVRFESVLLLGVLFATGVLTTREPAHDHAGHVGHADHDHQAIEGAEGAGALAQAINRLELDSGTLIITPTASGELSVQLADADEASLSLEATPPAGGFEVLETEAGEALEAYPLRAGEALTTTLPNDETGVWQLFGELDDTFFELPVSRYVLTTPSGRTVTLHFVPTPSMTSRGASELFATVLQGGEPVDAPVAVRYTMHGMEHSSDEETFALTAETGVYRRTLSFPMVGTWEMGVSVGDEEVGLELAVLGD